MFDYYLCVFDYGYSGQFYQEVVNGNVNRYLDLNGNVLVLKGQYGYRIIDSNPPLLNWMTTPINKG